MGRDATDERGTPWVEIIVRAPANRDKQKVGGAGCGDGGGR